MASSFLSGIMRRRVSWRGREVSWTYSSIAECHIARYTSTDVSGSHYPSASNYPRHAATVTSSQFMPCRSANFVPRSAKNFMADRINHLLRQPLLLVRSCFVGGIVRPQTLSRITLKLSTLSRVVLKFSTVLGQVMDRLIPCSTSGRD
jgi:hypothetical protein